MKPHDPGSRGIPHASDALDVVIPARGESRSLSACLQAILLDGRGQALRVIVVLNGEGQADSMGVVKALEAAYALEGHELIAATSEAGKHNALNRGDELRRAGAVVYLDADAVILPGTLEQMRRTLLSRSEPTLATPRLHVAHRRSFIARAFGEVWSEIPIVADGLIGGGCYGVNASGRARWGPFPGISGDDAFVCALFPAGGGVPLSAAGIFVELPQRWQELVATRARWLRSAREGQIEAKSLAGQGPAAEGGPRPATGAKRWRVLVQAHILPALPIFVAVDLAARAQLILTSLRARAPRADWRPLRSPVRGRPPRARRPRILVIVVSYNSEPHLAGCLRSICSEWADLRKVVIDNASSDESVGVAGRAGVEVIRLDKNLGFAAAVNHAARAIGNADYLLLVNPDAVLDPGAIDVLVAAALHSADAGVLGGRGRSPDGKTLGASAFHKPSFYRAALYAVRLSSGFDMPRRLYGSRRGCWRVPAISGALMLIDAETWKATGGFDDRFFLYGEDVDLCLRAQRHGYSCAYVAAAGYTHIGEASSSSPMEKRIRMLAGSLTLLAAHGGALGWASRGLWRAGALLRVLVKPGSKANFAELWRRRAEWWNGYPPPSGSLARGD